MADDDIGSVDSYAMGVSKILTVMNSESVRFGSKFIFVREREKLNLRNDYLFFDSKLHNTVPFPPGCTCVVVIRTRQQPPLVNIRAEAGTPCDLFLSIETQQQEVAVDWDISMDI